MASGGKVSDEALFEGFRRGNERDFEALLRRYERPLFSFLYRQRGNIQEAQDLFQETWLRVHRSAARFETGRRFSPWLYQIAYRLSIDSRRRRVWDGIFEPEGGREQVSPDIQNFVVQRDLRRRVRELVDALSEELRTVVILKHYQGLSYEEVAEIVCCPVGTVKSRMHKAMSLLRKGAELSGLLRSERYDV